MEQAELNGKLTLEILSTLKNMKQIQEVDHKRLQETREDIVNMKESITDMSSKVAYLYQLSLENWKGQG
ncbi:MAG: hypothetical protein PHE02_02955 [Lachnospiraceae bacterium]|nr:hypothetical protein [Lachnospiraceae bacterium]